MATTIRELLVAIGVEADADAVAKFDKALDDVKSTMVAVAKTAAVVTAAIGAVAVTTALAGNEIAKGAQRTALSTEEYQKLAFAAEKAGVSVEQFEASLKLANTKVAQAIAAGQDYIETTNGVRIAIRNADGSVKSQAEIMEETANAVANAATAQDKLAIATSVYGEEAGARLVPLLNQGAAGVRAMGDELEAMGGVMSEQLAQDSEKMLDALTDLKFILLGVRNTIGEALVPAITFVLEKFKAWFLANREMIEQRIELWAEAVAVAIRTLGVVLERVDGLMQRVGGWTPLLLSVGAAVSGLVAALAGFKILGVINSLLVAFNALMAALGVGVSVALGPFVAIAAAAAVQFGVILGQIAILVLFFEDLFVAIRGGNSVLLTFIEQNREQEGILGSLARLWEVLLGLYRQVAELLGVLWEGFGKPFVEGMLAGLEVLVDFMVDAVIPVLDFIAATIDGLTEGIKKVAGVLGIDLGIPEEEEGAAGVLLEGGEPGTSILAPRTGLAAEAVETGAALAPTGAAAAGAVPAPVAGPTTIGGNTYNITGVGLTLEEVEDLIEAAELERNRQIASASQGAEL